MRSLREWFGGRIQWLVGLIVLFAIIVCGIYMGLHVWQEYRTPPEERVAEAHRRGLVVNAWTVDDPKVAEQLAEWGVDQITSNILE